MNRNTHIDEPVIEMSYQEMKALAALLRPVYADSVKEYHTCDALEPSLATWELEDFKT